MIAPETVAGLPDALRGKSLLVFDESLMARSDHWFEYDLAIARMNVARGVVVSVVSHADFPFAAELEAAGAEVLPLARHNFQTLAAPGGAIGEWLAALRLARHFSRILAWLLESRRFDCVLYHTAQPPHLLSWWMLPLRLRRRAGRVVFSTWLSAAAHDAQGRAVFPLRRRLWRIAALLLRGEFAAGRFVFLTDSKRVGEEYRELAGLEAGAICSPRAMLPALVAPAPADGPASFVMPGSARIEKGADVVERALEGAPDLADPARYRFVFQWNRPVHDGAGRIVPRSPLLTARDNVVYLDEELGSREYAALIQEAACVILPYRLGGYLSRSSGVAIEAACAGIPMIYTDGGWLGDFVREYGAGIAVPDGDDQALAAAIRRIRGELSVFQSQAVARSESARRANSPQAFLAALWGPPA